MKECCPGPGPCRRELVRAVGSSALAVAGYALVFEALNLTGLRMATGLVAVQLVRELGRYVAARRVGVPAQLPVLNWRGKATTVVGDGRAQDPLILATAASVGGLLAAWMLFIAAARWDDYATFALAAVWFGIEAVVLLAGARLVPRAVRGHAPRGCLAVGGLISTYLLALVIALASAVLTLAALMGAV